MKVKFTKKREEAKEMEKNGKRLRHMEDEEPKNSNTQAQGQKKAAASSSFLSFFGFKNWDSWVSNGGACF